MNVYEADVRSTFRVDVLFFACRTYFKFLLAFALFIPRIEKDNAKRGVMLQRDIPFQFCPVRLAHCHFIVVGKPTGDDIDTDCSDRSFE